jgi:hypothetical protein
MIVAIADTHTAIWYLFSDPRPPSLTTQHDASVVPPSRTARQRDRRSDSFQRNGFAHFVACRSPTPGELRATRTNGQHEPSYELPTTRPKRAPALRTIVRNNVKWRRTAQVSVGAGCGRDLRRRNARPELSMLLPTVSWRLC